MTFELHRRLAIPLWAVAVFTVAVTAPPTASLFLMPPATVFAVAVIGIAAIVFLLPDAITRLRASRSLLRGLPSEWGSARARRAARTGVRKLHESNATDADDALDLIRMDDNGGWQMPRPRA